MVADGIMGVVEGMLRLVGISGPGGLCFLMGFLTAQSLHLLLTRWCLQIPPPPQSLHTLLSCWCSQMLLLPQSLHWLLCRWCSQMLPPPQNLLLCHRCWCSQSLSAVRCLLGAEGSGISDEALPDVVVLGSDVVDVLSAARTFWGRFP